MKKKLLIFIVFSFLLIPNIYAITPSGSLSSSQKIAIYPYGDNTCSRSTTYDNFGGVYKIVVNEENNGKDIEYISTDIYKTKEAAENMCKTFIKENYANENKDTYICKGTKKVTAYACKRETEYPEMSGIVSDDTMDNLDDYLTYYDKMYIKESECLNKCDGACELSTGYKYNYVLPHNTENIEKSELKNIRGDIFQTENGGNAFCIQPGEKFFCTLRNGVAQPQYCLNNSFNLNSCNTNYNSDYRCGLAHILLHATKQLDNNEELSTNEFAAADVAMRMWAAYKGKLKGIDSLESPVSNTSFESKTMFFAITAQRVIEDSNYLANGLKCSLNSKNSGVICDNGNTLYMEALKLFNGAYEADKLDINGNKVPELITNSLSSSNNTIQITNPTGEICDINDPDCDVEIILKNASGEIIPSDSTYCDKNYCYVEYKRNLCELGTKDINYTVAIRVKNFEVNGSIKEYRHCTKPDERQIMYVLDATGKDTIDTVYYNEHKIQAYCTCTDDSIDLTATTDSVRECTNKNVMNTDEKDYDGIDGVNEKEDNPGYVKDPSMGKILASCSKDQYFRAKEYELDSNTCKIYCRNEIKFYLANKEKVYSGMQFRYELEEKMGNKLQSNQHITAIVYQQRECVSEIDFDDWEKRFIAAEEEVEKTWNEWKIWEARQYYQNKYDNIPIEHVWNRKCSANCGFFEKYKTLETSAICEYSEAAEKKATAGGTNQIYGAACDAANTVIQPNGKNYCFPECTEYYEWPSVVANAFVYPSGANFYFNHLAIQDNEGKFATSNWFCKMTQDYNYSYTYTDRSCMKYYEAMGFSKAEQRKKCISELSDTYSLSCRMSVLLGGAKSYNECSKEIENEANSFISRKNGSITSIGDEELTTNGSCSEGTRGNYEFVNEKEASTRAAYNAAQKKVQELLVVIQNCNMYGSGLAGEQNIINYTLTKGAYSGSGGGNGYSGSNSNGNDDRTVEVQFHKEASTIKEYNSSSLYATVDDEYQLENVAKTNNSSSMKRKIMVDGTCVEEGSCVDLEVEYEDTKFGEKTVYNKVSGIVETKDLYNVYCDGNLNQCYLDDGEMNNSLWSNNSYTKTVDRIVCDNTSENPLAKSCSLVSTTVPINDYVSFKVTTEVDFYRPKTYVTEAFSGKVIEIGADTNYDSEIYKKLGKNVYPVSNDKVNSMKKSPYEVNYTFTNLGISKFTSASKAAINKYEYSCSYEVYNNSTGYDCDPGEDPNKCYDDKPSVNDTVPDLGELNWTDSERTSYGFVFRNVDLSNIIPNDRGDKITTNWDTTNKEINKIINDIQSKGNDIFTNDDNLVMRVTLTPDSIKKIREYNRMKTKNSGGYLDNSLISCDKILSVDGKNERFANCRSTFIDEIETGSGVLGIEIDKVLKGSDAK